MGNLKALESVRVSRHTVAINIHTYILSRKSISLYVSLHHKVHLSCNFMAREDSCPLGISISNPVFLFLFCARETLHERALACEKRELERKRASLRELKFMKSKEREMTKMR